MPDVRQLGLKFRRDLLNRELRAQAQMLSAYEAAWERLSAELERITTEIQERGETASLLFQQERLRILQQQLANEINSLASLASRLTTASQQSLIELAGQHATSLMRAAASNASVTANFARLPTDALTHLVGTARDGSVVDALFTDLARKMGLESAEVIKKELVQGVALGWNPRRIAAQVRRQIDAKGDNLQRDPAIVRRLNTSIRQQTLGAYREATRLNYEQNKKRLGGWRWTAARSPQTCVICWAMDGEVFEAGETMDSHISCRCVMVPVIEGDEAPQTGADAFAALEPGYQRQILGDSAYAAYKDGEVDIKDFVGVRVDDRWGASRFRRGLEEVLKKKR